METEARIERYIVDELMMADAKTKIDPDQSLISSGVIDSLAILRLIVFLEEQFGISVDDDEVVPENFETINIMKSFVQNKLS
jgi:acyl carrier protein